MKRRIDVSARQHHHGVFHRGQFAREQRCESHSAAGLDHQVVMLPGEANRRLHLGIADG